MGEFSEGMIIGGEDENGENVSLLFPDKDLPNGSKVF